LSLFNNFLRLCAGHTGQIVSYSAFSNNLGIDVKTVKAWFSVLEASYVIFMQPPYYNNFNKRIIKAPRLFFYDTGLACSLLRINNTDDLAGHYLRGGLFESFIISELVKIIFNRKLNSKIYFFRDSNGNELDAVIEHSGFLKAVEIKSGKTIIPDFFKGFTYWDKIHEPSRSPKYLVYGGDENQNRSLAKVLSWQNIDQIFEEPE
jgi:predicted AAA+ superfamily ATPase